MRVRFEQMDVNKDGVFSDEDIRRLADNHAKFSGVPDTYSLYYDTLSSVWSYGFLKGDKGIANVNQFVEGMKSFVVLPEARETVLNFCNVIFKMGDKNGDGEMSYDEFRSTLRDAAEMNEEMIDMIITKTDIDGDGIIQLPEYQQTLMDFFFKETP